MPPSLRHLGWVGSLLLIALPAQAQSGSEPGPDTRAKPRLEWSETVWCVTDRHGRGFRVQESKGPGGQRQLLVAPDQEASGRPLSRTSICQPRSEPLDALTPWSKTAPRVSAVAEAPPGWYRDDQGRVFQVAFDLRKRYYLGVGWAPVFESDTADQRLDRAFVDMGLEASWLNPEKRTRHTIRAVEGHATFDDLEAQGTLLSWEMVHASTTPLLRITTFFGTPRRYDTKMDMGFGARVLRVHHRPHRLEDRTDLEVGEAHVAWYPWHSDDLYDVFRLTLGGSGGIDYRGEVGWQDSEPWIGPRVGMEFLANLDRDGFHHVHAGAHAGIPVYVGGESEGTTGKRARAEAGYELIVLAVNDQPLSLHATGVLDWRNDLPDAAPELEASARAGLRFSFWAPAREHVRLEAPYRRRDVDDVGEW